MRALGGQVSAGAQRTVWELLVDVGVGPLRFGMSPAEVAVVLHVPEPQARVGGPWEQEDYPHGVKTFYEDGKLVGVALDAVVGPQVFFADFALGGSDPGLGRDFFIDYCQEHGSSFGFDPDASPLLLDFGIIVREQRIREAWLTRPLFVTLELMRRMMEWYPYELPMEGVTD